MTDLPFLPEITFQKLQTFGKLKLKREFVMHLKKIGPLSIKRQN